MVSGVCSTPSPSSTPFQFSSLSEANSYRLKAIVERLTFIMNLKSGSIRFDSSEFFSLCFALARGVDYALTINDVPGVSHRLPSLLKQVYQRRNESSLQPAIMMLLISVKNACKNGWFVTAEADELLKMTNELFSSFCMTMSISPGEGSTLIIISHLVSRFYPQYKFCRLLLSFEAKPGYEILMSDFQVPRNIPPEEKIMLIVVQKDNLETSSCIISPSQVSFLVNGKGVDKRTNVSLDSGPQFPTDITKMLKYGTNIIQAIGYFTGTYLITLAFMSKITLSDTPILKDYVQPISSAERADSEIIEGASRITLNCPFSFKRIRTPVKGRLCKHHQCFDFDNFLEMNSRKPSWRCPCCNQPASFIDLCVDQHMVKILKDAGEDVIDIVISADGSWESVVEHDGNKDKLQKENVQQNCNMESASAKPANTLVDAIDLTMGEDDISDSAKIQNGNFSETEDTKPFKDGYHHLIHQFLKETQLTNQELINAGSPTPASNGTSESIFPPVLVNPISSFEASQPNLSCQQPSQVGQLAENMQLPSQFGNLMVSHEPERLQFHRNITRTPVAVQALAVPTTQPSITFKRMRVNGPNPSSPNPNDSSSTLYQTPATGDTERQHLPMTQNIRSPPLQHVVSLPAPNQLSSRVATILQRESSAAAGSSLRPSSDAQSIAARNLSNLRSLIMSGAYKRPNTTPLPLGATRELARQVAQQKSQGLPGPSATLAAANLAAEVATTDKNWRPTGRMRGSLTGNAYSAALNHYAKPAVTPGEVPSGGSGVGNGLRDNDLSGKQGGTSM